MRTLLSPLHLSPVCWGCRTSLGPAPASQRFCQGSTSGRTIPRTSGFYSVHCFKNQELHHTPFSAESNTPFPLPSEANNPKSWTPLPCGPSSALLPGLPFQGGTNFSPLKLVSSTRFLWDKIVLYPWKFCQMFGSGSGGLVEIV